MFRRSSDMKFKWFGVGMGVIWSVGMVLGGTLTVTIIWAIYHIVTKYVINA